MIYKEQPKDWNQTLNTAGCFLTCGNEFLMLQRIPHKSQPLTRQLPGGKIDEGESELEGIIREVLEETGLKISKDECKFLKTVSARYENEYDFLYHMFKVDLKEKPEIKLSPNEHQAFDWLTVEKSLTYPLLKDQGGAIKSVEHILFS